jgi:hypothetical protein
VGQAVTPLQLRQAQTSHESVLPTFKTYYGQWTTNPTTAMGLCPHGPRNPEHSSWLAGYLSGGGTVHDNWNKLIPWAVVFPDGCEIHPTNSMVAIRDFGVAYWNKSLGRWVDVSRLSAPYGGQYHSLSDFSVRTAYQVFSDGENSCYAPPPGKACELWTSQELFDYDQIGGVCSWITHRHIANNAEGEHERWLIQIAADYWPDGVASLPLPGVGMGRIQRVMPEWRTATMYLSDGSFDASANPPPNLI